MLLIDWKTIARRWVDLDFIRDAQVCVRFIMSTTDGVDAFDCSYNRASFGLCFRPSLALNVDVMARVNQDCVVRNLSGKPTDYLSSSC